MRRATSSLIVAVLLFTSCSSGDGDASETTTSSSTTTTEAALAVPDGCSIPTTVEVRLRGDGARVDFEVVDTAAVRTRGGVAYTVYLADFPFPPGHNWRFGAPELPDGTALLTTGLDYFDVSDVAALRRAEVGSSGQLVGETGEDEFSTFLRVDADNAAENTIDQAGITEVIALTPDDICLHTDIRSANGIELVGTFTAPILADL